MDYKKMDGKIYVRVDKDEEILRTLIHICENEQIQSATFHGIGACGEVVVATYIPEKDAFLDHRKEGLLELVSLDGNITHDETGKLFEHTHAAFSCLSDAESPSYFGGHLKSAVVNYTAEIVLEPVCQGDIGRMVDPKTGITVWKLS